MKRIGYWIEAMRLRTLPVGAASVLAGVGLACLNGSFRAAPAVICLVFAILAQIASNFANEYFDYRDGLDAPGREGPRRGVTEGDITPRAMLAATWITLGAACAIGCLLILWGGWWLIAAGAFIAVGVLAYSTGPFPLSRHALGEVAVLLFYGIVPVNLVYYLQTDTMNVDSLWLSVAIGLLGSNILVVNNYRDRREDEAVDKRTEVVLWGRKYALWDYAIQAILPTALTFGLWLRAGAWTLVFPTLQIVASMLLLRLLATRSGHALNPVLGMTAMTELFFAAAFLTVAAIAM